jgi:hypothetical protein
MEELPRIAEINSRRRRIESIVDAAFAECLAGRTEAPADELWPLLYPRLLPFLAALVGAPAVDLDVAGKAGNR